MRAGNSGTLPPAAHRLHEMKKPRPGCFFFWIRFPPCSSHTSNAAPSSPSLSRLTVSSLCLCLLVFGTPSSSITSPLQLSLASLDLAWFARVALPCYCARNPFSSFLIQICFYDMVITSVLLCLFTFFSLAVHRALTFCFMLYSFFLPIFFLSTHHVNSSLDFHCDFLTKMPTQSMMLYSLIQG